MSSLDQKKTFPARVVKVLDSKQLVINRGYKHGVQRGQRIVIYELSGDELIDPETFRSLGQLEIVKAEATLTHVQDTMAIAQAVLRANLAGTDAIGQVLNPFRDVKEGDYAKPV